MSLQEMFCFPLGLLLGSVLLVASAPATPELPGCSDKEQQVTVSHTYKIDVPKSALVQVEADPQPLSDDGASLLALGEAREEQNIIFRHNIRLQTPQKDCELATSVQDLLARVKQLEEEMMEMKKQCSAQRCCQGATDLRRHCSGHGTFSLETCSCHCQEGWEGAACEQQACPGACSGHGRCVDGRCLCHEPYVGADCGYPACPENCSGHGECVRGVCQCHEDFTSEDCSERRCPGDCSGHGFCDTGECYCEEGFAGLDCAQVVVPQGLQLLKSTEDSLLVSWEPSSQVDHYLLSYYPLGKEISGKQIQVPGEQHSYEILNLLPGTKYIVTLRNVKKEVSSSPQHLLATTDIDSPKNLVTDRVTENMATVSWDPVQAAIDKYVVRYTSAVGETREVPVGKEQSSTVLTGLRPGVEYTVHVWAQKGDQESVPKLFTQGANIDSPQNLATDRVTENMAIVSWEPVQATIDRYVVRYTSAEDGNTREVPVEKEGSSTILTGLRPGVEYTVHVWAQKGAQESKKAHTKAQTGYSTRVLLFPSSGSLHLELHIFISIFFSDIDSPKNLVTDRVTENMATVSWDPVQAAIDKYVVRYTSADGETREVPVGKEQSSAVLTGLSPGVEYTVHVWAQKGDQESKKAHTKAQTGNRREGKGKPGQSVSSGIEEIDDTGERGVTENVATVSWDPVQAAIDKYVVCYTSADDQETREVPVGREQSSAAGRGVQVHVWAQKGGREIKKAHTKAQTELDPPRNLRPSAVTQSGGVLTWTPPSAQIHGYILTYQFPDGTVKEMQLGREDQRFELQGLEQGATYPVSLVAFKGDRRSRNVSTTLSTVGARFPHPSDCSQVQQNNNAASGLYTIYLHGEASRPLQVYCDMHTDGGGWIVFQRRNTGQLDFFKRWRSYVEGFGDPRKEFWLGLDNLHNLTTGTPTRYEVRVDLQTANESAYAIYDFFQVASSKERYKLTVGKYRGTAGDALSYHNGWKFTTFDRDNDIALSNCALTHHGGWWYKNCHLANPNGRYGETKHSEGVNWEPWKGHEFSIPYVELKIRPRGYSSDPVLGRKKRTLGGRLRTF
uniref:Tenascin-N n=1 Tax=Saimiri boliviensis boliviensis TaxID=39432 RepID=A0A2K6T4X5_SAIBB